ncbi:MAG: hypothetical protein K9J84_03630, partial [Bacteroidia bacterium]|nr:hypothetical protein [Bacteroidia bacterium]
VLNQIKGVGEERTLHLNYEKETKKDFLFIWGQFLLVILTIGFYYPWAFKKMGTYILSKTSLQFISKPSQTIAIGELPNAQLFSQALADHSNETVD